MVGLQVGPIFHKIGNGRFLHSFFSTIAYNLENNDWGSRFPNLMKDLYYNSLQPEKIESAQVELQTIKSELEE